MKVLYTIQMKQVFFSPIALIWLLFLGVIAVASPAKVPLQEASEPKNTSVSDLSNPSTILVLGDSLSSGYGINPELGWVSLLQQKLVEHNYRVVNGSVSGETAGGGLARLPTLLQTHTPDIVVIELGGNDGLRGHPLKGLSKQLSSLVLLAKQADAKVVLLGMKMLPNYGKRYTEQFEKIYSTIAIEHELDFVPFFLEGVAANAHLMQLDGIHPNEGAQILMLNNLWPVLKTLLQPAKKRKGI